VKTEKPDESSDRKNRLRHAIIPTRDESAVSSAFSRMSDSFHRNHFARETPYWQAAPQSDAPMICNLRRAKSIEVSRESANPYSHEIPFSLASHGRRFDSLSFARRSIGASIVEPNPRAN
jgi:hypothetical protein